MVTGMGSLNSQCPQKWLNIDILILNLLRPALGIFIYLNWLIRTVKCSNSQPGHLK
jgi:hypothetical protein